jgi:hypothetical protein
MTTFLAAHAPKRNPAHFRGVSPRATELPVVEQQQPLGPDLRNIPGVALRRPGLPRGASFFAGLLARSISRYATRLVLSEIALTHGKPEAHYASRSSQDVTMRFTVHAEQRRGPVEFEFASAVEAIRMAAGATRLYIYDDEMDEAYWPNTFAELHKVFLPQGDPAPCEV